MFNFNLGKTPAALLVGCPACVREAQEEGQSVVYRQSALCPTHRTRYAAMLRDTRASQQAVYFWLRFLGCKHDH